MEMGQATDDQDLCNSKVRTVTYVYTIFCTSEYLEGKVPAKNCFTLSIDIR